MYKKILFIFVSFSLNIATAQQDNIGDVVLIAEGIDGTARSNKTSPNNEWLVFIRDGDLYSAKLDGPGQAIRIVRSQEYSLAAPAGGSNFLFDRAVPNILISPDSKLVVFPATVNARPDLTELYSVPINGGQITQLTDTPDPYFFSGAGFSSLIPIIVSPDNKRVIFSRNQTGGILGGTDQSFGNLFSVPLSGGSYSLVGSGGPYGFIPINSVDSIRLSNDKSRAVYALDQNALGVRNMPDANDKSTLIQNLYVTDIAGGCTKPINLSESIGVYAEGRQANRDFSLSPNGKELLYMSHRKSPNGRRIDRQMYVVDMTETPPLPRLINEDLKFPSFKDIELSSFTYSGENFIYTDANIDSFFSVVSYDVFSISIGGGTVKKLAEETGSRFFITNDYFLFYKDLGLYKTSIAKNTAPERVIDSENISKLSKSPISPKHNYLLYIGESTDIVGQSNLYKIDLETQQLPSRLFDSTIDSSVIDDYLIDKSGTLVIYFSNLDINENRRVRLFVGDIHAGFSSEVTLPQQLVNSTSEISDLALSPDNSKVFLTDRDGDSRDLYTFDLPKSVTEPSIEMLPKFNCQRPTSAATTCFPIKQSGKTPAIVCM